MATQLVSRLENAGHIQKLAKELSKFDIITIAEINDSEPEPRCYAYVSHNKNGSASTVRIHYISPIVEAHGNDGSYSWGIMRWSDVLDNLDHPDMVKNVSKYMGNRTDIQVVLYSGVYGYMYEDNDIIDMSPKVRRILASIGDIMNTFKSIPVAHRWKYVDDMKLGQKFILTGKRLASRESALSRIIYGLLKEGKSPNFCIGIPYIADNVYSILMEHCGDTMYIWMSQQRRRFSNVFSILLQLTFSLFVLKSAGITHGDIHLCNVCIIHTRSIQNVVEFKWGRDSYTVSGSVCPVIIDFSRSILLNDAKSDTSKVIPRLKKYLDAVDLQYVPMSQSTLFDCMLMLDLYKLYSTTHGVTSRTYKKDGSISHMMDSESVNSVDQIIDAALSLKNIVKQHIKKTISTKKSSLSALTVALKKEFTVLCPDLGDDQSSKPRVTYIL